MTHALARLALLLFAALALSASAARAQSVPDGYSPRASFVRRDVHLALTANVPNLIVLRTPVLDDPGAHYDTLCVAPCEHDVEPGPARFAVMFERGDPMPQGGLVLDLPRDATRLQITFENHEPERLGGVALAVLGGSAGMVAITFGASSPLDAPELAALYAVGFVAVLASVVTGIWLIAQSDRVAFEFDGL